MTTTLTVKTFRFKFSDEIMNEINDFARTHRFDTKDNFKDAWNNWIIDNMRLINAEKERLEYIGFHGDIIKKMYISARYYFKNKPAFTEEPKPRRKYITIDKEYIRLIDDYIDSAIAIGDENVYKPANCFQAFVEENIEETQQLIQTLLEESMERNDIIMKIKKTFKNRYFVKTAMNKEFMNKEFMIKELEN